MTLGDPFSQSMRVRFSVHTRLKPIYSDNALAHAPSFSERDAARLSAASLGTALTRTLPSRWILGRGRPLV